MPISRMNASERGKLYYRVVPVDTAEPKFSRARMRAWCYREHDKHQDAPSVQVIELIEALLPNGPKWVVYSLANIINHAILSEEQIALVKFFLIEAGITQYDKLLHECLLVEQKQIETDGPRTVTAQELVIAKLERELAEARAMLQQRYTISAHGGEHPEH